MYGLISPSRCGIARGPFSTARRPRPRLCGALFDIYVQAARRAGVECRGLVYPTWWGTFRHCSC